jgi:hypothetical protein
MQKAAAAERTALKESRVVVASSSSAYDRSDQRGDVVCWAGCLGVTSNCSHLPYCWLAAPPCSFQVPTRLLCLLLQCRSVEPPQTKVFLSLDMRRRPQPRRPEERAETKGRGTLTRRELSSSTLMRDFKRNRKAELIARDGLVSESNALCKQA